MFLLNGKIFVKEVIWKHTEHTEEGEINCVIYRDINGDAKCTADFKGDFSEEFQENYLDKMSSGYIWVSPKTFIYEESLKTFQIAIEQRRGKNKTRKYFMDRSMAFSKN